MQGFDENCAVERRGDKLFIVFLDDGEILGDYELANIGLQLGLMAERLTKERDEAQKDVDTLKSIIESSGCTAEMLRRYKELDAGKGVSMDEFFANLEKQAVYSELIGVFAESVQTSDWDNVGFVYFEQIVNGKTFKITIDVD